MERKSNMKKYLLILIAFSFLSLIPVSVFATSGACSSHGGVNCSAGADYSGKVQCNDGWVNSSVYFSDTDECKVSCVPPVKTNCSTEADYAIIQQYAVTGGQGVASADGLLQACRSSIIQYQAQIINYNSCLATNNNYSTQTSVNTQMQNYCVGKYGSQSLWDSNKNTCECNSGYAKLASQSGTTYSCVPEQQIQDIQNNYCHSQFGENSYSKPNDISCFCSDGYLFDKDKSQCVSEKEYYDKSCKEQFGELAEMTNGDKTKCSCPFGYEFNSAQRCEKVAEPVKTTENPVVVPIVKPKPKTSIKSSVVVPAKIVKEEPIKTTEIITPAQTENTTVSTNPAPVKKLAWYQKIFNWLFK